METLRSRRAALSADAAAAPLAGLRVLDLTQIIAGPLATMMLADAGAEVIKVEPPDGEAYRRSGDPLNDRATVNLMRFGRGKKSVVLDLKLEEDRERLAQLIVRSDVLVENYRAGVLERLGFGWDRLRELQPQLVYTTITGFGADESEANDYRERPAYALVAEAMGGLMHLVGEPNGRPLWMGFAMTDIFTGTLAFGATMLALRRAEETGEAQRVDMSLLDAALVMNDLALATYAGTGKVMNRGTYTLQSPWGAYRASDGYVAVAVFSESQWEALARLIGRDDLADRADLRNGRARSAVHDGLIAPALEAWTSVRTRVEVATLLEAHGVPGGPVNTAADLVDDPALAARGMLIEVDGPGGARTITPGPVVRLVDSPPPRSSHVPELGEHTAEVLTALGEPQPDRS